MSQVTPPFARTNVGASRRERNHVWRSGQPDYVYEHYGEGKLAHPWPYDLRSASLKQKPAQQRREATLLAGANGSIRSTCRNVNKHFFAFLVPNAQCKWNTLQSTRLKTKGGDMVECHVASMSLALLLFKECSLPGGCGTCFIASLWWVMQ
jgi:hypothetical protein